jgi:hypothetical protein
MSGKGSPFTPSGEFWSSSFGASCCFPLAASGRAERFRDPELLESTIRVEFAR